MAQLLATGGTRPVCRPLLRLIVVAVLFSAIAALLPGCGKEGSPPGADAQREVESTPQPADAPDTPSVTVDQPAEGTSPEPAPPGEAGAPLRYVAPDGVKTGEGTRESPWDIASALAGEQEVAPGTTIFLLGGTYRRRSGDPKDHREKFDVRLEGAEQKPIHVRPFPGERPVIDGGLAIQNPSKHLWIWDLEIIVSEPQPTAPVEGGSHPASFTRPWGGLNIFGGDQIKCINMIVRECRQGVSWWSGNTNTELHGCIIYDNGWPAVDRGHGHAVYTQNKDGVKTVTDCIFTGGHGWTMHAYGSKNAYVDNYRIEGNIAYNGGQFLVGGGRPSRNCRIVDNYLYNVNMRIGYSARDNEGCEVANNVVFRNSIGIVNYASGTARGNLVVGGKLSASEGVEQDANDVVPAEDAAARAPLIVLRPNKYAPGRAHLAVFNWGKLASVRVDTLGFLKDGDEFRLQDPKDFHGPSVHEGVCRDGAFELPMKDEFAAFVVLRRTEDTAAHWKAAETLNQARALYDEGKADEALKTLREAGLERFGTYRQIEEIVRTATAVEKAAAAGDVDQARNLAVTLMRNEPRKTNAFHRRAQAVLDGFSQQAARLVQQGTAAEKAGNLVEAAALYRNALKIAPDHEGARKAHELLRLKAVFSLNLGLNLRREQPAKALPLFRSAAGILGKDDPQGQRAQAEIDKLKSAQ